MQILFKSSKSKTVLIAALAAALFLQLVVSATARPSKQEKKSEAERIKSQVAGIDRELGLAVEDYNQANVALKTIERDIRTNTTKLAKAEKELAKDREALSGRLCDIYKRRDTSALEVIFGAKTFQEFLLRLELVVRIGKQDAKIIKKVVQEKKETEKRKAELEEGKKQQKQVVAEAAKKKNQIESQIAERKRLLAGVEGEIGRLEQEERQIAARIQAPITVSRGSAGPARGGVVGIAMQQRGKPYRYGAAGPGSFDCSGLVMYCYAQIGVRLPHSSRAQYGCGARISRSQLAPGDLVFFGSPIHHVGIYVGGGSYIHAPHTGDVVKISPLNRGDYAGACRI